MADKKFTVTNRHIDGGSRRKYFTLKGAIKRFEDASGWTVKKAIEEQFWETVEQGNPVPNINHFYGTIRAIDNFGGVHTLIIDRVDGVDDEELCEFLDGDKWAEEGGNLSPGERFAQGEYLQKLKR